MKVIYPGSFDPVTNGHLDIISRSAKIADELIVGVLNNNAKSPLFSIKERVKMLEEVTGEYSNVKIIPFEGLLVDFAKNQKADAVVRGLRAITDFEYELQMAQMNYTLCNDVETIFFTARQEYSYLSSTIVKEIASYGGDISQFVPALVEKHILEKIQRRV